MVGALAALLPGRAPGAPLAGGQRAEHAWGDEVVKTARAYQATLDELAAVREAELARAARTRDRYRDLYARGLVARRDAEEAARLAEEARARLDETRRQIAAMGALIAEVEASREVAELGASSPDDVRATSTLVRYDGPREWTLRDMPDIERFFAGRFGRALPISAFGQTPVHARLGLDHARAVDVALHPDSDEGRVLIAHLRGLGIPFLAFRTAITGASTGAHVHIGRPSQRPGATR